MKYCKFFILRRTQKNIPSDISGLPGATDGRRANGKMGSRQARRTGRRLRYRFSLPPCTGARPAPATFPAEGKDDDPRSGTSGPRSASGWLGRVAPPPADAASAFRTDGGPPCGAPARCPVCIKYFIKFPWLPFVVLFSRQPEERPRPRQPPRPRKKGN